MMLGVYVASGKTRQFGDFTFWQLRQAGSFNLPNRNAFREAKHSSLVTSPNCKITKLNLASSNRHVSRTKSELRHRDIEISFFEAILKMRK